MAEDKYIWQDQNGIDWDVRDMTDRHLSNAIRFLERKRVEAQRMEAGITIAEAMMPSIHNSFANVEQANTDLNSYLGAIDHSLLIMRKEWQRRHLASQQ